jgi:hypothetical protein
MALRIAAARAKAVHSAPSGCVGKKLQTDSNIAQPAMSRRLETGPTNITSDRNISLLRDLPKREGKRPTTLRTALHLQSNDQGPLNYLKDCPRRYLHGPGWIFAESGRTDSIACNVDQRILSLAGLIGFHLRL